MRVLRGITGDDAEEGFFAARDIAEELLSIAAVHPIREDIAETLLARHGADRIVLDRLTQSGKLSAFFYEGKNFTGERLKSILIDGCRETRSKLLVLPAAAAVPAKRPCRERRKWSDWAQIPLCFVHAVTRGNPIAFPCRGLDGEENALAVAYCCNCSFDPPMAMVGIVQSRYSHCFVVNLVDRSYKETFDYLGSHSKRDGNKLAVMKVKLRNGKKVNAPILPDAEGNIDFSRIRFL